jgi:hypothetical protein
MRQNILQKPLLTVIVNILISAAGSALFQLLYFGNFKKESIINSGISIPLSTFIFGFLFLLLLLYSYLNKNIQNKKLLKNIDSINEKHGVELKKVKVPIENLRNEIETIQNRLREYESVENNVLTILEERGHATIQEISQEIQSLNRNISGEQILNAISHLQSSSFPKIRNSGTKGLQKSF